ncbi:MAG: MBL fold metallo-hydrolase [Spirochaetes bacterium]|jgi:ribonuclease BN (tRNA processing enzyme)|nr:MBL fold metallo-hydrolase [Spirochaetota bacterium]
MKVRPISKTPLSLRNRGALSIIFVGTGSAFTKNNYQNNIIIVKGNDHLIVDVGTLASRGLAELGLSVMDLRNYFITHLHADHIGGLEEVMLVNRYVAGRKPTIHITEHFQDLLWNLSLRGGAEYNERHDGVALTFPDFWNIKRPSHRRKLPREGTEFNVGSINIKTFRTRHYPEQALSWEDAFHSEGLLIDDRVLFTGDTQFDPELIDIFDKKYKIETIFHDVQFFTGGIHAGLEEVATLPASVRKRILLMHYPDSSADYRDSAEQAGMRFAERGQIYTFSK